MKRIIILLLIITVMAQSCTIPEQKSVDKEELKQYKVATFAGGCFWCTEAAFEGMKGVKEVISGYAGGTEENPTYMEVAQGQTSHREVVQIYYDDVSYRELVQFFFKQIDPTDDKGQFVDKGFQYTTAIFYTNEEEKKIAEEELKSVAKKFDKPIVTEIVPFTTFYEAEEYHQDFAKKKTAQYKLYEMNSGRKEFQESRTR